MICTVGASPPALADPPSLALERKNGALVEQAVSANPARTALANRGKDFKFVFILFTFGKCRCGKNANLATRRQIVPQSCRRKCGDTIGRAASRFIRLPCDVWFASGGRLSLSQTSDYCLGKRPICRLSKKVGKAGTRGYLCGIDATTFVPAPIFEVIVSVPPSISTRSFIPNRPNVFLLLWWLGFMPTPSSSISMEMACREQTNATVTRLARACRPMLTNDSCNMRYSVVIATSFRLIEASLRDKWHGTL